MSALNRLVLAGSTGRATRELGRLLIETDGQDAVEYALLTACIGFAGAAAWNAMLTSLGNAYHHYNDAVLDLWEPADPLVSNS